MTVDPKKSYHHGNLKEKLIEASAKAIAESGIETLSLRKVADGAGVSHNAPYMHFKDKEALLAAVAEAGFLKLTDNLQAVVNSHADKPWKAQYFSGCLCYVEFALANKGYVQSMFRRYDQARFPALRQTSITSIQSLVDVLREGQHTGHVKDGDLQPMVGATWTILHGLAMLLLHRDDIPAVLGHHKVKPLVESSLSQLLDGLQA